MTWPSANMWKYVHFRDWSLRGKMAALLVAASLLPLAVAAFEDISGSHQALLDAEGQDWLREILLNAKKMGELIDGLLSLARVTRSDLKLERVDLSEVATQLLAQLATLDPSRRVDVAVHAELEVVMDPRLARVLLGNLLENAWKFTSKTPVGRIEFNVAEVNGAPAFLVHDNGAGFDMAFATKLFAPFQRLHTVMEFPGTGIGLATVQRIVRRHQGRIWAEGAVGDGATFYFTLGDRTSGMT